MARRESCGPTRLLRRWLFLVGILAGSVSKTETNPAASSSFFFRSSSSFCWYSVGFPSTFCGLVVISPSTFFSMDCSHATSALSFSSCICPRRWCDEAAATPKPMRNLGRRLLLPGGSRRRGRVGIGINCSFLFVAPCVAAKGSANKHRIAITIK